MPRKQDTTERPAADTTTAPSAARPSPAGSQYESREDRRLGLMLMAIGIILLLLPWVVPGAFQGVGVGLVLGKIVSVGFLAGGIYRFWTAHKALSSMRQDTLAT